MFCFRPSLIEEIALFPSDVYIEKIDIVRVTENGRGGANKKGQKKPKLIVLTRDQVCSTLLKQFDIYKSKF